MGNDDATTRDGEARPRGWEDFREARQRFLDRLERQTELLRLERLWEMPPLAPGARRRPSGQDGG